MTTIDPQASPAGTKAPTVRNPQQTPPASTPTQPSTSATGSQPQTQPQPQLPPHSQTQPQPQRAVSPRSGVGALFDPATWKALAYHTVLLFLGPLAFVYVVTAVSLGLSLAILTLGLIIAAGMILGARGIGEFYRRLTNNLVGTDIPAPAPLRRRRGFGGFLKSGLMDSAGWRALLFMFLTFITSMFTFIATVTVMALGFGGATYALWYRFLPLQQASDGSFHRGAQFNGTFFMDTPERVAVMTVVGVLLTVFVWPAVNNGLARGQAALAAGLLGPTAVSRQQQQFQEEQFGAMEETSDQMRSIERDLHDVTQAQLVAIAMKLGDAKDRLAAGEQGQAVEHIIASAHATSKSALTDLRGLVQGIHPSALDAGLGPALLSLASNSAVAVDLDHDIPDGIAPVVEATIYHCVAELLTNVAKHSGVTRARVIAYTHDDDVVVKVSDSGCGGAHIGGVDGTGTGTGLVGLARRVSRMNGTLDLDSPAGGPTVVTVRLPRHSPVAQ